MNNVILIGRMTRDPELRYLTTGSNTAVARFNLAVDRQVSKDKKQELESQNKPTADFINCKAWGKLAENICNYVGKGQKIAVEGRLETSNYEKDGTRVYVTEVVVERADFIDWGSKEKDQGQVDMAGFMEVSNENIPF